MGKAGVSARAIDCRRPAIEHTSARVPMPRNTRTCARTHKKEDRSQLRSSAPLREEQLSRNPILESVILLGFLLVLVAQGLNLTIFRVSRVFLDSINRLVNTKKHTGDFGEDLTAIQGSVFRVYSFPFSFIL
jgi:hypothetical protein